MFEKCRLIGLLFCCSFLLSAFASEQKTENFDVVIFGATPSGITAAVAASREKARVIVIGPEKQAGGMVTGGLCRTDYGDPTAVGGLAREYFQLCKKIGGADEWYNEPHVFQKAMSEWISAAGFTVRTNERLTRVKMNGRRIVSITTSAGNTYTAPVFIDATYEGDLMARAGVSYIVGREPKETYGEIFAGVQHAKTEEEIDTKELEDDCPCLGGKAEHYIHGTKMKIEAWNADGSLKKGIGEVYPAEGTADSRTQAYCFRLTVTQRPDIRIPFQKPAKYDPERYQILLGILEKYPKIRFSRLVHFGKLPNGKFDMNSSGLQSVDFVGGNIGYPDGNYKNRDRIWQEHKNYQQGFLWFLAHDPRVPKSLQAEVNSWGLCRDEFTDNGNWPYQLYVREARRMAGAYVLTENDLLTNTEKEESVGLGSFLIDSHHIQYLKNGDGWIETEGTIAGNKGGVRPGTYEIPYSALIPKEDQCENLIVPVCLSASHVAYGSLRMEPVYMILGHASGLAAVMAKNSECPVQKINIKELQQRLVEQKQQVHVKSPNIDQANKSLSNRPDFHPAQIWSDTNGNAINAHGGGVLFFEGIYYWYGEHKLKGKSEATFADGGIHCYSSVDLINWKDEGIVLSVDYKDEKSDLAYGCILERPKVVYNEKNRQFVAYFKLYLKGVGYETSNVGVAIAEKPTGPFNYHHKFHGGGSPNGSGDFSMFKDDDGSLYHLTVRKPDKAFVIGKMDDNYYYPAGAYQACNGITFHTEAPAVIKRDGIYHLLGSGSSGWKPNAARYFTSDNLLGKWTYHGNPCLGINPIDKMGIESTYGGQSSNIIQVRGEKDAFIAMFDIWKPENPVTGRYIWLPVEIEDGKFSISWRDSWGMSVFDNRPENHIASSQAGASPLFFDPESYAAPVIQTQNFSHPDEFKLREGLPNVFNKVKNGKSVTLGYLGGSITRADNQYRLQSAKFIQNMFPGIKITGINAGVSGTGSDLGACRLYEQLLKYNPDLIFVEFAVNGAFQDGVEGIVRQIWKYNPKIDICFVYTISAGQTKIYANGNVPENIRNLEKIADHYAVPSVHMGLQPSILEKQGKLIWKSDSLALKSQIIFSADGTHPLEAGGNLYAEAIARSMLKMKDHAVEINHPAKDPLIADNWEDAKMVDPKSFATFSPDWETIDPGTVESLKQFSGWFPYVMKAEKPGSWIRFRFNGTMLGIFDIGGPEVGQIELELDGVTMNLEEKSPINFTATENKSDPRAINRFNHYCNNRYRGQCVFIKTEPGIHTVVLKISNEIPDKVKILGEKQLVDITLNPQKYNRSVIYLGKILLRGEIIQSEK